MSASPPPLERRDPSSAAAAAAGPFLPMLRAAARLFQPGAALLCRVDASPPCLVAHWGELPAPCASLTGSCLEVLCLHVARLREPLAVEDGAADLRFRRERLGVGAFLGVPLAAPDGETEMVLAVVSATARAWAADDVAALEDLARLGESALEQQRLAAAAQQSEDRYERLLAASPDAIYTMDREGRVVEINAAAATILDRPLGEVVGRSFREFVAPEDLERADAEWERVLSGVVEPRTIELRVQRASGERRLLEVSRTVVVVDGEVQGAFGVARDVTDERAREMHFRRAERMASVAPLLSGVCHELNNPLTSIKSFAELLLLDERPSDDREALEIVHREANRAAKIISDLRVVARHTQEAGTGRGLVDLNGVMRRALELRRNGLEAAGITFRLDLGAELPPAWAVRTQVEEIVLQLMSNAEQAMLEHPGPRELTLRTHRGSLGVALHVEDTGPGVAEEHLDRIFDPFWTTRRPGEGTGLGLSLVQSIVTDHGGRIRVDTRPGRGAAFTVELPIAEEPPVALGEVETEASSRRPLRILVVDDEAAIRYSLQRYLERRGHRVAEASDGAAALELLDACTAETRFDIILADLRMPGLNGEQLLERLRERGEGMEQRVIFITGDQDSPDAARVLERAGVPVVQKPFELAEIVQIVEVHAGILLTL